MYIITELAANGSLKDFLIKDTGKMTTPFLTGLAGIDSLSRSQTHPSGFNHEKAFLEQITMISLQNWVTKVILFLKTKNSRFLSRAE